jgi:hypothetical protein
VVFVLRLRVNDERTTLGTPDFEADLPVQGDSTCVQGVNAEVDLYYAQGLPSELKRVLKQKLSTTTATVLRGDVHAPDESFVAELDHALPLYANDTSQDSVLERPKDGSSVFRPETPPNLFK